MNQLVGLLIFTVGVLLNVIIHLWFLNRTQNKIINALAYKQLVDSMRIKTLTKELNGETKG